MFHIQVDQENIIRDCIEYPHPGYIEVPNLTTPLPESFIAGWHKWENGQAVLVPELKQAPIDVQIAEAIDAYTLELMEGGLL